MRFMRRRSRLQRADEARRWLTQDERGRVIGLIIVSVALSIAMVVLTTAIVGAISRRRAAAPEEEPMGSELHAEADSLADEEVGVAVMEGAAETESEVVSEA